MGHPAPMVDTSFAQLSQKRACPHGTNANPSRGAIKQTSHESDATDALGTGDGDASGELRRRSRLWRCRLFSVVVAVQLIAPFELNF